jgi:hypothetical protein
VCAAVLAALQRVSAPGPLAPLLLQRMPSLASLVLAAVGWPAGAAGLAALQQSPRLTRLEVQSGASGPHQLRSLMRLTRLQAMRLRDGQAMAWGPQQQAALAGISALRGLRDLAAVCLGGMHTAAARRHLQAHGAAQPGPRRVRRPAAAAGRHQQAHGAEQP